MNIASIQALRHGVTDRRTVARYWKLVWPQPVLRDDLIWIGALSAGGHGRFWIRDVQGKDIAISSHRFRWALEYGVDSLLGNEAIRHNCDEAACQQIGHLVAGSVQQNTQEFFARRDIPGSPLRDTRGPQGRAIALRNALIQGEDITQVARAGDPPMDRYQATLFD